MPTDAQRFDALRLIFPDLRVAKTLLGSSGGRSENLVLGGGPSIRAQSGATGVAGLTSAEQERGSELLELIARYGAVQLTSTDRNIIDAIVWKVGRPALFIDAGTFVGDAGRWTPFLEGHRVAIEANVPGVGRIESASGGAVRVIGTGFVIGEGLVMTNRHVARQLHAAGRDMQFATGTGPRLDMRAERRPAEALLVTLGDVVWEHAHLDAAVLRFKTGPGAPPALPLAGSAPQDLDDRAVYVIGHPLPDSDNDQSDIERIFGAPYGVKRLSPGNIMSLRDGVLRHDASTLGGSSGSCVVDLTRHTVLGLHYQGWSLNFNEAIALWPLRSELESALGVQFQ